MRQSDKQKKKKNGAKWGLALVVAIAVVSVATIGIIGGNLIDTTKKLALENGKGLAEAVLTSENISGGTAISVPILYYGQAMDECVNVYDSGTHNLLRERQFEWSRCGVYDAEIETGMVEYELDEQFLPIALGGRAVTNRGVVGDNYLRWFSSVEGKSVAFSGTLNLVYDEKTTSFEYGDDNFYPLSERNGGSDLFTMNMGVPFRITKSGDEKFVITADDDTWVFVNNKLVIDMGGIHNAKTGVFKIDRGGEVYASVDGADFAYSGVTVEGDDAVIRVFHANRDSAESVLRMRFTGMILSVMDTSGLAQNGAKEIAYDPSDPTYVAPLGESITVRPDGAKAFVVSIIVQIVGLSAFAAVVVVSISVAWRCWRRDHSQVK